MTVAVTFGGDPTGEGLYSLDAEELEFWADVAKAAKRPRKGS